MSGVFPVVSHGRDGRGCAAGTNADPALRRTVAAAAAGDERAWQALVVRFTGLVRGIARSYRLGPADVDDVAQETWVRLLRHIAQVQEPTAVAGWLATTTRREALRALQRTTREVPAAVVPDTGETDAGDPLEDLIAEEARAAVHGAVARLPACQRALVRTLLTRPHAGYDEVADRLGRPRGSVGPTRGRALARLREDPDLGDAVR